MWRLLGLDTLLAELIPRGQEEVPWATVAAILVIARFCEPASELHIAEDWYRRTALEDILGVAPDLVHDMRLYRGLDQLLPHKADLEAHLKHCYGELFAVDFDLLLYDVTSTYFEGEATESIAHASTVRDAINQLGGVAVTDRDTTPIVHTTDYETMLKEVLRTEETAARTYQGMLGKLEDHQDLYDAIEQIYFAEVRSMEELNQLI